MLSACDIEGAQLDRRGFGEDQGDFLAPDAYGGWAIRRHLRRRRRGKHREKEKKESRHGRKKENPEAMRRKIAAVAVEGNKKAPVPDWHRGSKRKKLNYFRIFSEKEMLAPAPVTLSTQRRA